MKFYITRTSGWYVTSENPPIDGITLINPNHEELEDPIYTIDLDTLDDLIALVVQAGHPIIVGVERDNKLTLEIYDTYRE